MSQMKFKYTLMTEIFEFVLNHRGCRYKDIRDYFLSKEYKQTTIFKYLARLMKEHLIMINHRYYIIPIEKRENYKKGKIEIEI